MDLQDVQVSPLMAATKHSNYVREDTTCRPQLDRKYGKIRRVDPYALQNVNALGKTDKLKATRETNMKLSKISMHLPTDPVIDGPTQLLLNGIGSDAGQDLVKDVERTDARQDEIFSLSVRKKYFHEKNKFELSKVTSWELFSICLHDGLTLGISYYDPISIKWFPLVKIQTSIRKPLYYVSTEQSIHIFDENHVLSVDLKSLAFFENKHNRKCCQAAAVVFHDNKVYFVGGSEALLREVLVLDVKTRTDTVVGHMVHERIDPAAALLGNDIYITGGWSPSFSQHRCGERFNTETRQFDRISSMNETRSGHSCAALNGSIYVCGGYTENQTFTDTAEVYNVERDQWILIEPMRRVAGFVSLICYNMNLYAFYNSHDECFEIERYDPEDNGWLPGDSVSCSSVSCTFIGSVPRNSAGKFVVSSPGFV